MLGQKRKERTIAADSDPITSLVLKSIGFDLRDAVLFARQLLQMSRSEDARPYIEAAMSELNEHRASVSARWLAIQLSEVARHAPGESVVYHARVFSVPVRTFLDSSANELRALLTAEALVLEVQHAQDVHHRTNLLQLIIHPLVSTESSTVEEGALLCLCSIAISHRVAPFLDAVARSSGLFRAAVDRLAGALLQQHVQESPTSTFVDLMRIAPTFALWLLPSCLTLLLAPQTDIIVAAPLAETLAQWLEHAQGRFPGRPENPLAIVAALREASLPLLPAAEQAMWEEAVRNGEAEDEYWSFWQAQRMRWRQGVAACIALLEDRARVPKPEV